MKNIDMRCEKNSKEQRGKVSRRGSMGAAGAVAAFTLVPSSFFSAPASNEVSVAGTPRLMPDSKKMKVTNVPEANQFITKTYRKGWEI